jgi:hypothetical protein
VSRVQFFAGAGARESKHSNLGKNLGSRPSELELQAERAEIWNKVCAQRRKIATLFRVESPHVENSYHETFKKAGATRTFKGAVNDSHRLFVLSCDLLRETGSAPWHTPSPPLDAHLTACLAFVKAQHDVGDVRACFDGCLGKNVRRELEDAFHQEAASLAEVFIVYDRAPNTWATRKNFMASRNTEVGYVALPTSRSRLSNKDRAEALRAAEDHTNSYWTTFSGVPLQPRSALPLIKAEEKEGIFNKTDAVPPKWKSQFSGVPLFWQESKPASFWEDFLLETSSKELVPDQLFATKNRF